MGIEIDHVNQLLDLVRKRFPDWNSFADERFNKDEIRYKRKAVAKAQELLSKVEFDRLQNEQNYDEIISRLAKIGHFTNLLWTAVPKAGDLNVLYNEALNKPAFCLAINGLLYGTEPAPARLEKYCDFLKANSFPNFWPFPTYLLFLFHPETEFFIRPKATKWFLKLIDKRELFTASPSASCYSIVKAACMDLKEKLAGYGAADMVDVQSIIYVASEVSSEAPNESIDKDRKEEIERLFVEFAESYPNTEAGKQHASLYEKVRVEARQNYQGILDADARQEDITDAVLLKLLPYNESPSNREKRAWVHVAPAITGDIKAWFETKGWVKHEDWPRIAKAILRFVQKANENPSNVLAACLEFSSLEYTKGFQTGMLSPILNALRPDDYVIINNKSRRTINFFTRNKYRQNLVDYPAANEMAHKLIAELSAKIQEFKFIGIPDNDVFDMFCHWLVAIKNINFRAVKYWKIAPGADAWNWDACRSGGFVAIGWDELGDISGLSKVDFDARYAELMKTHDDWTKAGSTQVWNFANLEDGDRVVANKGTTTVLGLGIVTGDYYFVPGVSHGHRVPVEWYDLKNRSVTRDGWRRTMVKLTEEEFRAIENTKSTGEPPDRPLPELSAFSSRAFSLLSGLHENPTKEYYKSKSEEFWVYVEEPLQRIMKAVAAKLPQPMLDLLETEKGIFGKITKNDYGRGGTWDYYWGAFYPKGGKRITDAQLFLWINRDVVTFGFYIGEYGIDQREKFIKNSGSNAAALLELLKDSLPDGLTFYGPTNEKTGTAFADWLEKPDIIGFNAAVILDRASVENVREEQLVERIVNTYKSLFPFVILATSDEPMPKIREYLEADEQLPAQPMYTISQFAEEISYSEVEIRTWVRAVERKGQIVLYGPPGTGKTFISERLARYLVAGGSGFTDIIQFHPAYAYEDFVQGIRPKSRKDGGLEYPIVEGRFMDFCRRARNLTGRCVLIIDEINRANLSRVFGELMYLLEYRQKRIPLAVGGEFQIPSNVLIIGTMNTADRSIALVDHALRRRFAFIALSPKYEVLKHFHQDTGFNPEGLIKVLANLNNQIGDPHYEIGITFFLLDDIEKQIEDVWRMEIEPYLEEYFFDQRKKVNEFRWDQVKRIVLPEVEG
jgi:5-methylcytosine-specific restriction protein B